MNVQAIKQPLVAVEAPRHRGPVAKGWLRPALLIWAVIYGLLITLNADGISRQEFHDPDDQLRLQQVRDLIAGQPWFDLHQYRIAAADGGVLMHWSRLVDAPIAAVILALRPFIGAGNAETAALVIVPGLTLLAIVGLVGWIAIRALPRAAAICSMLILIVTAPVIVQVLPARIDHHGWQIVLALAAVAALLDRDERRGGYITGATLAGWMAISFEGVPLSAWIIAVLSMGALLQPAMRVRLVAAMQALAFSSVALFLATRGLSDLLSHCDAIAPVHVAAFVSSAVIVSGVQHLWPRSRIALVAGLGTSAAVALTLIMTAAPQCASGTFDMLDPLVRRFWYDRVLEGKPIFQNELHMIAQYTLPALLGVVMSVSLARRAQDSLRPFWACYTAILAGALVIGILVARSAAFSGALAVVPLGGWVMAMIGSLKRPDNLVLRLSELLAVALVIFCMLMPVVPVLIFEKLVLPQPTVASANRVACRSPLATDAINALPGDGLLAAMDIGPDLLIHSNKSVLSTGHHRGAPGMRATIEAFLGTPQNARSIMIEHRLRYVVVCPRLGEQALYMENNPNGFAAQLKRNETPAWLRPVPMPAKSQLKIWERVD